MLQRPPCKNHEYVASLWLSNEKNVVVNMIAVALMWSMWKCVMTYFIATLRGVGCRYCGSASFVC
jgi:hypothetical protein